MAKAKVPSSSLRRLTPPPPLLPSATVPPSLPFDLVESILTLLPTADLLSAAAVSTSWRRAALSSPRRPPALLLIHCHTLRSMTSTTSTSAFDPNSPSWLHLPPLPSPSIPLRSTTSCPLLYTLTSSQLSFSSDPLHLRWTHIAAPSIWRVDPIVALAGSLLVVAGGVSEFEDDPLAVEVFDGRWRVVRSMPEEFRCSACSTFLSATVAGGRVHVIERQSGLTCSFDPEEGTWSETAVLLAGVEPRPFTWAVAAAGDGLVVAGMMGLSADVTGLRLWGMSGEMGLVEIGEMPEDLVVRLARGPEGDSAAGVSAIELRVAAAGDFVYVYNISEMGEMFYCRVGRSGGVKWGSVKSPLERGWNPMKTVVVTCSPVGMEELREALRRDPVAGE